MKNNLEILKEYNQILNEMIGNVKSFEEQNYSMTEKQEKDFFKRHETLSKTLDNVANKLNK